MAPHSPSVSRPTNTRAALTSRANTRRWRHAERPPQGERRNASAIRILWRRRGSEGAVANDVDERGIGAGEGNRTLVFSLEGCCSTIELHPRCGLTYHAASAVS